MKIQEIITSLFVSIILVSCAPAAKVVPTETAIPTLTITPIPSTPTISPTPVPDFATGLIDYATVYARTVPTDQVSLFASTEMVANRLVERGGTGKNGEPFKALIDPETSIILFLKMQNGEWKKATIGELGYLSDIEFTFLDNEPFGPFREICGDHCGFVDGGNLSVLNTMDNFKEKDWQLILDSWEKHKVELDNGIVPSGYPYNWKNMDIRLKNIQEAGIGLSSVRIQKLMPGFDDVKISDFVEKSQLTREQTLNLLEFVVKARVIQYKDRVDTWDVGDEVGIGYITHGKENFFWGNATGLSPAELVHQVAVWVKEVDPSAKTTVVEEPIFDTTNPNAKWMWDYFYNEYLPELSRLNAQNPVIDSIIGENNYWIGEPQDWDRIDTAIKKIQDAGFEIGGAETMIVTGPVPINPSEYRKALVPLDNPEQMQAIMFKELFKLYLNNNVRTFGLGAFSDSVVWTTDLPDASPAMFDKNSKPKLAYFVIMQILSERLLASN
jgi:GH35 family endo-1,4-beta-xylanase